jgi:competence protein ComEC
MATGSPREGHQTATLATPPEIGTPLIVAATLPRYPELIPGDRVLVEGEVRPPPDTPYGEYLRRIGAAGTISSRTLAIAERPTDLRSRLEGLRRSAAATLAGVLPEPEAGLAAGILIGLRDRVDRDLAAAFTTAGVSHVVAISGWNIAIVAAAVAALAGRVGRRRRSLITVVAIAMYVVFAGASASVVRAAAMAGVVLLARESGRAGRATAALGWAVTLLLLTDPELIGDAGFQLSSLATAGLIAWASPLTARIERFGRGRLPGWLAESLGVSLAAQAATLPIVLASFGRLALLSPLVNLVVVPLVAPAMAVGLVALVGGLLVGAGFPSALGAMVAAPGWVVMRLLVSVVEAAATLPFASVTLTPPWDSITAAGTLLGLGALVRWRRGPARRGEGQPTERGGTTTPRQPRDDAHRAQRAATGALVLAVAVTGGVLATRPGGNPRVTVLDIGQGDAILVEGSRGARLLVDGGPDPDRLLVALDKRVPPWDRRIDTLLLSHPHEDHVAGLVLLLARYDVRTVLEVGMTGPGPGYGAWDTALRDAGAPNRRSIAAGDRLRVDEIDLRVLWPRRGQVPTEPPDGGTGINNVSVVLAGSVVGRRFLLMGDVEEAIDPALLAAGLPRVDLLKVAHHGSRTATTQAFVDAVRPRIAVASAGADNPYGHPTRQTLERLVASGARVLRTDRDGSVVVSFTRQGISLRAERVRDIPATPRPSPSGAARVFRCAIPVVALIPEREAPRRSGVASRPTEPSRWDRVGGYHRLDDRARAGGGRRAPALPGSPTLAPAAFARRRGGGRLAGGAHLGTRVGRRSGAGRVGGVAPRCRQGTPRPPSGPRAPPWPGVGRMAHGGGLRGTRPACRRPSRHPAPRWRVIPPLGGVRVARGTDRRVRGQASWTTARIP